MDPNRILEGIRGLYAELDRNPPIEDWIDVAHEFAYLVNDLDEWLSKGGFPPDAWRTQRLSEGRG